MKNWRKTYYRNSLITEKNEVSLAREEEHTQKQKEEIRNALAAIIIDLFGEDLEGLNL